MAKSTNYRGIHISVTYNMGYEYYEIPQINKGKKWNDKTLFATLKEAKMYIDEHYDELIKNESKKTVRKSIKESDYIFQLDEFSSLMKKEDITVKVAKNGYVFFADDETLGNNLLGFINPNTSNQKLHIKVPMSIVASLDEFENTKELVDFIISEYSHNKRKFESKKSARKSMKEQFVGKGEGGYRKPDKTKFNSGICLDSNGVKHTVIFDTRVEDFIVWVDNDNYLMWYVSSPQSLLNNLAESDLDENLILDIVALWEKLPKKRIKK